MRKITRDQVVASFLGVAIGDALGAPVETMTRAQIKEIFGKSAVTGYLPKVLHKYEWARGLAPGATTDDWALTAAVAEAIIKEPGGVSLGACVGTHLHAYRTSPFGFGKTTRESLERWAAGGDQLAPLFSYEEARKRKNSGNGTIMKMMPAIILGLARGDVLGISLLHMSSRITHRDPRSLVLAFATYAYASRDEQFAGAETADIAERLIDTSFNYMHLMDGFVSAESELFAPEIVNCLSTITPDIASLPSRFTAMETAPFVISVCQHAPSFQEGVLTAVNAGGDTDTNASIVGGILGLRHGTEAIPQEWIDGCLSAPEAIDLANKLCDALDIT